MKVRIKTWDEMVNEFGFCQEYRYIDCTFGFIEEMEQMLPEDRIIKIELSGTGCYEWRFNDEDFWDISDDMIAEVIEETDNTFYSELSANPLRIKPKEPVYEWQWYQIINDTVNIWDDGYNDEYSKWATEEEVANTYDASWKKFEETKRERK